MFGSEWERCAIRLESCAATTAAVATNLVLVVTVPNTDTTMERAAAGVVADDEGVVNGIYPDASVDRYAGMYVTVVDVADVAVSMVTVVAPPVFVAVIVVEPHLGSMGAESYSESPVSGLSARGQADRSSDSERGEQYALHRATPFGSIGRV